MTTLLNFIDAFCVTFGYTFGFVFAIYLGARLAMSSFTRGLSNFLKSLTAETVQTRMQELVTMEDLRARWQELIKEAEEEKARKAAAA